MADIKYLGSFPPPYGGVTIKNKLLYEELSRYVSIERRMKNGKVLNEIGNLLDIIFWKRAFIIGISASRGKSGIVSKCLYWLNRTSMRKSIYFMMGGLEAEDIANDPRRLKHYAQYKQIFVETKQMVDVLEKSGLVNVSLFPNCRRKPIEVITVTVNRNERLRCVFFSNIQRVKGVDWILEAAKQVPNVEFYLYGYIENDYEKEFHEIVDSIENVFYKGIFDGKTKDAVLELNKYDVLLFPTRWKNEGVPGVLVEGKIAGLAEVVTNVCYNAELVQNGKEGIVINSDSSKELMQAIKRLNDDRDMLQKLKEGSKQSADRFYIENYINQVISFL